jgi:hypothetical protein
MYGYQQKANPFMGREAAVSYTIAHPSETKKFRTEKALQKYLVCESINKHVVHEATLHAFSITC